MELKENYKRADLSEISSMISKPNALAFINKRGQKIASIVLQPKQVMLYHGIGWGYASEEETQILRGLYVKLKN